MPFRLWFPAKAPRPRPILWAIAALVILALVVPGMVTAQINCDVSMTDLAVSNDELQLMAAINTYRTSLGVPALSWSPVLTRPTAWMANDLATRSDRVFSHTDSLGRPPFTSGGSGGRVFDCGVQQVPGMTLAENLAAGNPGADATFQQWKNSPGHDANMKNATFRSGAIGRSYRSTAMYGTYWTLNLSSVVEVSAPTPTPALANTPTRTPTTTRIPTMSPTHTVLPPPRPTPVLVLSPWLYVLSPTPAYSVTMDLLWVAQPGERYWVRLIEDGWALAIWEGDPPEWQEWIEIDGRLRLSAEVT